MTRGDVTEDVLFVVLWGGSGGGNQIKKSGIRNFRESCSVSLQTGLYLTAPSGITLNWRNRQTNITVYSNVT